MFYISWGKKSYQKTEGIAADFCPICRRAVTVEVKQIRSQTHIYSIGFGKGDLTGRLCRCITCDSEWALQAGTIREVVPISSVSLETLIAETYPRFYRVNEERLEQEAAIKRDPFTLDAQTRIDLIAEPFLVLENDVQQENGKSSWHNQLSMMGCYGSLAVLVMAVIAFSLHDLWWGLGSLAIAIVVGFLTATLTNVMTRGFMRKRIYPRLASCLAPLNPSPEEIAAVIHHLKSKVKCAEQTDINDFLIILEEAVLDSSYGLRSR